MHAVPVGEAARVTPDLGRAVALHAGVVPAGAAAARGKRITNTESGRILDKFHGGAVVIGVDELHRGGRT